MAELKKNDPTPLYRQAMRRILALMEDGTCPIGTALPNETELCEKFGVSRITVRRAVSELAAQGYLEKKQGKGTFVTSPGEAIDLREVSSFHEACRRRGSKASTRVIHAKQVTADARDIEDLRLLANQKVIETYRVRCSDNIPVMVEINHFSTAYSYLTECDLGGSLYNVLREYGVEPTGAVHDISIAGADAVIAGRLSVPVGTPLLYLEEVIYDQKGRPLHNSRQWIRGDKFTFRI